MNVDAQKSRNNHENKRVIDCKKRLNIVHIHTLPNDSICLRMDVFTTISVSV